MNHVLHILSIKTLSLLLAIPVFGCDPGLTEPAARAQASADASPRGADGKAAAELEGTQIVARVNQVPIDAVEVERRLDRIDELYRHARRPFNPSIREAKRREVIDRLIDRELLRQHIDRAQVEIAPKQVDLEVESRVEEHFGSTTAFRRYLQAEGLSMSDFRREVHEAMVLERTLLGEGEDEGERGAAPGESANEAQLREIYERVAAGRPAGERIRVSSVTLPAHDRQRIARIGREHCDAATLPEDATREDLGWRQRHQLPAAAGFRLFDAGEAAARSAVVPSPDGRRVTVYCVHERRAAGVRAFDEVEPLLRERANRALLESKRRALLESLREQAAIERLDTAAEP